MPTVFGIDLGTTYSCIARVGADGRPEVLANLDGETTVPSVVRFTGPDDYVTGTSAAREQRSDPHNVCSLVKRRMGEPEWRYVAHGRGWTAPQVSSLILRSLATDASFIAGETVQEVIITVPAYFGDEERRATKRAGEFAGLTVVDIINEPTAAAIAHGLLESDAVVRGGTRQTVLVYDLGGGTFDITIIELAGGVINVLATDGDHELGGADWDEKLAVELARRFVAEHAGIEDPFDDSSATQAFFLAAEAAKRELSNADTVTVDLEHAGRRTTTTVTRADFDRLTDTLMARTIDLTHSALHHARARGVYTIDRVLLVGGSSRMPQVASRLRSEFQFAPVLTDPDLVVAKGAALYGQKKGLEREVRQELLAQRRIDEFDQVADAAPRDFDAAVAVVAPRHAMTTDEVARLVSVQVNNVLSRAFGVVALDETGERYAHFLTHRNERLPVKISESFGTVVDDQPQIRLAVVEQAGGLESRILDDNNVLAEGYIDGIPPGYPAGTSVSVTLFMDYDGILQVTASHVGVDEPLRLQVETATARDDRIAAIERAEIGRMRRQPS